MSYVTSWGAHKIFEGLKLQPDTRYAKVLDGHKEQLRILYYGNRFFDIGLFVDIIIAEFLLRAIVQGQSLKSKQRDKAQHKLYLAETMFPIGPIKQSYESLRQNTTWYLRKELVEDCVKRGGCCGRTCGCCQIHHEGAERTKGVGHCTPACGCCSIERGFEYTKEERQGFVDDFKKKMYDDNPACVIQMAEAFFLPPPEDKPKEEMPQEERTQCEGAKKPWWKRMSAKG
ncbi:hypothetical protein N7517_003396 [Penicillium concentricum]|uniref:Uncharacterized protein n=1 Tax=Penicillium concentricum TaxID=293559 RepID=A0A9W9SWF7_9EURO|nr:uncharacterized protein N7517_003396 [Penicillium concentricum]KAJ5385485.1 hypothetical protein N7517_003396 [Penicillium concentricum]